MRESTSTNTKGSDFLFMLSCMLCTLYIIMRVIMAGMDAFSPQVFFLSAISLGAMLAAILSRLVCNGLILPPKRVMSVILLCVMFTIVSMLRAEEVGCWYIAKNMGSVWAADLFICIAIMLTARERNVFRLYVSTVASSVVVAGVYALYQKVYALEYLRTIAMDSVAFKESIRSKGAVVAYAFIQRIEDGWVGGGFGSSSALCAFALLFLFLVFGIRKKEQSGGYIDIALFMGLLGVVLSGSWYGIILAKVFEIIILYKIVRVKNTIVKDLLLVIGGVGILTIMSVVLGFGFLIAAGSVIAQIMIVVLWYVEIELLRRRYSSDVYKNAEYLVGIGVLVMMVLVLVAIILAPSASELGYIKSISEYKILESTYSGSAAWNAFVDAPIMGWGLDNFSEVHSFYKYPMETTLGRAGNLYLEILADGGLVLFGIFVLFVSVILFSGTIERREHREVSFDSKKFKLVGSSLIIVGFSLAYIFVALGLFDHMGIEYLISEISSSPESFTGRGVSIMPLVIHFLVNIIVIPMLAIYAFKQVWVMSRGTDYNGIGSYIRLGLIAFLLYSISGDYLFHPALSGYFWVMIGLLLARKRAWGMLNFRPRTRKILAYFVLILGIVFGSWGVWGNFVASTAQKVAMAGVGRHSTIAQAQKAVSAFDDAIALSKNNPELYVERVDLLLQIYRMRGEEISREELDDLIANVELAIQLRPKSSEYRIALARVLETYDRMNSKEKIVALYKTAQKMYPHNARYSYSFAKYLAEQGAYKEAQIEAIKAIKLDSLYEFDYSTRLRKYEIYKARGLANKGEM